MGDFLRKSASWIRAAILVVSSRILPTAQQPINGREDGGSNSVSMLNGESNPIIIG